MASLTLKRRYEAPASLVFRAWTEPEHLMRWHCPADFTVRHAESDPRAGGFFRVVMCSPEGEEHTTSGYYQEVVPDEKLVFSWGWVSEPGIESVVTVLFQADGSATELTLIHAQLPTDSSRDGHLHGWTGALDNLRAVVENKPA